MTKLDHEKQNRYERARTQGTIRATADLHDPAATRRGRKLGRTFGGVCDQILSEFRALDPEGRRKHVASYRARLTRAHDDSLRAIAPDERIDFGTILDQEWSRALDEIRALLPPTPSPNNAVRQPKKPAKSSSRAGDTAERSNRQKNKKRKSPKDNPPRSLVEVDVEAAIADNRLFASWTPPNATVRRWRITVLQGKRAVARQWRPSNSLATEFRDINLSGGSFTVRVLGLSPDRVIISGTTVLPAIGIPTTDRHAAQKTRRRKTHR